MGDNTSNTIDSASIPRLQSTVCPPNYYYVFAADESQSTNSDFYYSEHGILTLDAFKQQLRKKHRDGEAGEVVYLHWGHECHQVTERDVEMRFRNMDGRGRNTLPFLILEWLEEHLPLDAVVECLYVVTDGRCNRLLEPTTTSRVINELVFHAINKDVEEVDLSVATSFIGKNRCFKVYRNSDLIDSADLSKSFDYNSVNHTNYVEHKAALLSYIKLKFLNTPPGNMVALHEVEQLKSLRTHLLSKLEISNADMSFDNSQLDVTDRAVFLDNFKQTNFYRQLQNEASNGLRAQIHSDISTLINYIENAHKSLAFDTLKFDKRFSEMDRIEDPMEVPNEMYENVEKIAFPDIILANETGVPVILLTHYDLFETVLFKGVDNTAQFSSFRMLLDCPLGLLRHKDFRMSIEYYYNLDAFKDMLQFGMEFGPRTRRPFTGGIVPLDEFDDYNDYVLAHTYFKGRRVNYNKGLFYYVLWKTCSELEYIKPNVTDYLKKYVMRRIAMTECFLGLGAISVNAPRIRVRLTTALWYCMDLSSEVFKDDPLYFSEERLRMYSSYVTDMKQILSWFPEYESCVNERVLALRTDLFRSLNQLKRLNTSQQKRYFILRQIFEERDGFLVAKVAHPEEVHKLNYLDLDMRRPITDDQVTKPVELAQFVQFLYRVENEPVLLCPRTMRPHFVVGDDHTPYYEKLLNITTHVTLIEPDYSLRFEPVPVGELRFDRLLSLYKLFIMSCTNRSVEGFPTQTEFKDFVLKRMMVKSILKTVVFPTNICEDIDQVYTAYRDMIDAEGISLAEFNQRARKSNNRANRIIIESPPGLDVSVVSINEYLTKRANSYLFIKKNVV